MARTVSEIQQQMLDQKAVTTALSALTSPSAVATWKLIFFIVAVGISLFEQILDIAKIAIEALVLASKPSTAAYIKYRMINVFQYDATTPQTLILSNFIPTYATIDATKRIVTRCSVKTLYSNTVQVKIAKSEPPVPLVGGEITAATDFLDKIIGPGVYIQVITDVSDKIYIKADVIFDGSVSASIQALVKSNINAFLASLSSSADFQGTLLVSDLEQTIKSTSGVVDVKMVKVLGRQNSVAIANATTIFDLALGINQKTYEMYAGYGVSETTALFTLDDSLTFIVATN